MVAPVRSLREIAREISRDWHPAYFGAQPYIGAMLQLEHLKDKFFLDDGTEIVARFLCNAQTWRGETARRIKKELNEMLNSNRKESRVA